MKLRLGPALFFSLSNEDKMEAPHPEGWAVHRGYSWQGLEKNPHVSARNNDELLK